MHFHSILCSFLNYFTSRFTRFDLKTCRLCTTSSLQGSLASQPPNAICSMMIMVSLFFDSIGKCQSWPWATRSGTAGHCVMWLSTLRIKTSRSNYTFVHITFWCLLSVHDFIGPPVSMDFRQACSVVVSWLCNQRRGEADACGRAMQIRSWPLSCSF